MNILLVEVHLYPAVPTHPNTHACIAKSVSASSIITIELFPPNSNIVLPNLLCTSALIPWPTEVDPVKDINWSLGS